jgi:hypothetical protein
MCVRMSALAYETYRRGRSLVPRRPVQRHKNGVSNHIAKFDIVAFANRRSTLLYVVLVGACTVQAGNVMHLPRKKLLIVLDMHFRQE